MTDTQGKIREDLMLSPVRINTRSKTSAASSKSLETELGLLLPLNIPTNSNTDLVLSSSSQKKATFMTQFPASLQGSFRATQKCTNTEYMQYAINFPQYTQLNFREIMKKIAEILCS